MADEQRLDREYAALAAHCKACLAFEQFHHRLQRSLSSEPVPRRRSTFVSAYAELQQLAAALDTAERATMATRLTELENRLYDEAVRLSEEDSKLSPGEVRRFVRRARRLESDQVLELMHFYVVASRRRSWDADLTDKIDFLMSRLGEEISGPALSQERVSLKATLLHLWRMAQSRSPQGAVVAALAAEIDELAAEVTEPATLDEFQVRGTIERYRKTKHGLGSLFVEPSIALAILRTNVALGRKVQELYDVEEGAIAAEFSRLERIEESAGFSEFMSLELDSLRLDIERLEEGRVQDDVRIDSVRRLRDQADAVLSRLDLVDAPLAADVSPPPDGELAARAGDSGLEIPTRAALAEDLLERLFGQLEALLVATDTVEEADSLLQDPGLPLDLERREIEGYLRLRDESSPDPDLDRRLLMVASLCLRLSTFLDHLAAGGSALFEIEAAAALDLAEEMLEWFRELVLELEIDGPTAESSEMRFLRVRLMSDYASLWLEIHGTPGQDVG